MLKTLDILIGATIVILLFSMAVTVVTQAITTLLQRKGKHLRDGLTDLLRQLGISDKDIAQRISDAVLKHPLVATAGGNLGTVIHREEFTRLLLDFSSGQGAATLDEDAKHALVETLQRNGISDPGEALKNIQAMALQLQASNPELANHVREGLAILHGASSQFVARVNSWFDQTIDRVSERFTRYTHRWVFAISVLVVLTVQLDIIGVVDRLSIDDQFRNTIVYSVAKTTSMQDSSSFKPYYNLLGKAGLIVLPLSDGAWLGGFGEIRKWPGMLISMMLVSLGAPFWYNILKQLLELRSGLADKDDAQRAQRQSTQTATDASGNGTLAESTPSWLKGERGDLAAAG